MGKWHLAIAVVCLLAPVVRAQDPGVDPWAGGRDYGRPPIDLMDEEEEQGWRGNPEGPDASINRLYRCRMNGLESAQYSIAELLLQRSDAKGAIAALQAVLDKTQDEQVRDLTRFNIAEVYRRRLSDEENAAACYRKVEGMLRHKASQRLLNLLAERGKADEALKTTEDLLAKAKEKGEKLALLHRLATVYKRHNMPDRALAVYQRIAKEFTPDDMKEILAGVERDVAATIQKIHALQQQGDQEAAERLGRELHDVRPRELRAAGRWDEMAVYEQAMRRGFRQMEMMERARGEAEGKLREALERQRDALQRAEEQRRREAERAREQGREAPRKAEF